MKPLRGVAILLICTIVSSFIANRPRRYDPGFGGFILMYWPPIVGIFLIVTFLIACAISKNTRFRIALLIVQCFYLIYVGLGLYLDKGWPFVY
jgi:hypothetical protein